MPWQLWLETATYSVWKPWSRERFRKVHPDLALVSPRQGAANMEGPLLPLVALGPPIFPCSPSPQDPRNRPTWVPGPNGSSEGHACPTPQTPRQGVRGAGSAPTSPALGRASQHKPQDVQGGCGLQTSLCSPTLRRGGQGSPSCPQGRGSLVLDASSSAMPGPAHSHSEGPGEGSGQGPAQSRGR